VAFSWLQEREELEAIAVPAMVLLSIVRREMEDILGRPFGAW
jgi:hypothetical protein